MPHKNMYTPIGEFDMGTVVAMASALLYGAGYDGANSGRVIAALEHRYDVLGTIGVRADTFLDPIVVLVKSNLPKRGGGGIIGRTSDVDVILRTINASTGEIARNHQQRIHSVAG